MMTLPVFERFRLRAVKDGILDQAISIYGFYKDEGMAYIAKPLEIEKMSIEERKLYPDPIIKISIEAAQSLMDDLWNCGLRPSEGTGSAGALSATQKHLDDMRSLVFDYLRIG